MLQIQKYFKEVKLSLHLPSIKFAPSKMSSWTSAWETNSVYISHTMDLVVNRETIITTHCLTRLFFFSKFYQGVCVCVCVGVATPVDFL